MGKRILAKKNCKKKMSFSRSNSLRAAHKQLSWHVSSCHGMKATVMECYAKPDALMPLTVILYHWL